MLATPRAILPAIAVISFVTLPVTLYQRQRLPDPAVVKVAQNDNLLRTDQRGWIELTTDEKQMWVDAER